MNEKTKDNLLYVGIALGIAAVIFSPLFYAISRGGQIPEFPAKPAWLIASTVVLIAYVAQDLRGRQLGVRRILPSLACIAFAHIAMTMFILHAVSRVPVLLLGVGIFVEAYIALQIIEKVLIRSNLPRS